jgi:hypothetical protein
MKLRNTERYRRDVAKTRHRYNRVGPYLLGPIDQIVQRSVTSRQCLVRIGRFTKCMRPSVVFFNFLETNDGADPQLGQHCLLLNQLIRRYVVRHNIRPVKGNSGFEFRPVDWSFLEVILLSLSRKILGFYLKTECNSCPAIL